jgi:hypothetical protein
MSSSPKLDDLIDALEEQSDSLSAYLDRQTGQVVLVSDEEFSWAESEPDELEAMQDWQKEAVETARQIENTDRYLRLPDRLEVHEWSVMRDFCEGLSNNATRDALLTSIQGNRAFRRFKDQLVSHNLQEAWNEFRRAAFAETLREWCRENAIELAPTENSPRLPR